MPAPVVVEIYAPQPRPAELAVLLAACSRAATPHDCVSSDAKGADSPLGVAIVRRDGDHARIELGLRSVASAQWSTRDLVFQAGDDELERYRAIGFAIGTLVARETEPPPPPPPAEQTPPPPPPPVLPPRPLVSAPHRERPTPVLPQPVRGAWVDVSGSVGLGLIPGPPRAGGSLLAAFELVPRGAFGVAQGGYAERNGDSTLRVRWLNAGLGVGQPLAPHLRSLGVDVRLMFVVERISFSASSGALSQDQTRWKPGITAAIDGHWDVAPPVGLVLSAATFIDPERTVVHVQSDAAGETPALGLSGFLGVRLKLR